ncbi:MAG: DNA polymerase III subunit beta [Spirochaetales bacterium]|nr:DNA polymerase III subunit beta [Spirochaetales bacterium]
MKFTCERDVILKEISIAQEIISSRNALSILSNVLLHAENNELTIRATDLRVGFETTIPMDVAVDGSTTVYCDKFLGILRSLPSGDVEFEQEDSDRFIIRPLFKKIDFRLKSIASDKFPELQIAPAESFFQFPQADLIDMIGQTIFAVSDDETRYFMNGVYLENIEGQLALVATDGRRLSYIARSVDSQIPDFVGVIVPPKILTLIRKLASGEGTVQLAVAEKNIFVHFDSQRISSALIEGQFPNYQRVIPKEQEYSLLVKRDELREALKRVSLLVEKSQRVYLTVTEGAVTLRSDESEIGQATEEISCDYQGPETTLAMNYTYLADPLRVVESEDIKIHFTESNKAITINPEPETDYFHVVMPMQLD